MRMRWATVGVLSLLVAAGCKQQSKEALAWESDEAAAYERARTEHKGVLVHISAAWSAPSTELEHNLAEPAVVEQVRRGFVPLRIDATDGDDRVMKLRERYDATTLPAIVMIAPEGTVLGRIGELVPPDQLAELVREAADKL